MGLAALQDAVRQTDADAVPAVPPCWRDEHEVSPLATPILLHTFLQAIYAPISPAASILALFKAVNTFDDLLLP